MDILEIIVIVLSILYIGYIVFEKLYHNYIRKSFKHVIHVNGIRGKSTVTRLIDAGLRNCGYKVFTKTTGTIPMMINVNNEQNKIKRIGLANIREQLKMMRLAFKEKAEILVIECMAINPELQYITEHQMLQSDITVLTNVRHDHIGDMGNDLNELANALANTIPSKGYFIVGDNDYHHIYKHHMKNKDTEIVVARDYTEANKLETFSDNIKLALEVSRVLDLDKTLFFEGMKNYYHDPCAYMNILLDNTLFLNGFSINDPDSIKIVYDQLIKEYPPLKITILLTVRSDRPSRTIQHIDMISKMKFKKVIIAGSNKFFIKRHLLKNSDINLEVFKNIEDLKKEEIIFAIGNIGGIGMKILNYFEENGVKQHG